VQGCKTPRRYNALGHDCKSTKADSMSSSPTGPHRHHLTISSAVLRGIVSLQNTSLGLVCLGEGVTALFAHALHLAHLPDGLLELLHPGEFISSDRKTGAGEEGGGRENECQRTVVDNLGCCIFGFLGRGGRLAVCTCV